MSRKKIVLILLAAVIVLACIMCACGGQNNAGSPGVNASAEKVIRTVMTYPNEELYDPDNITEIGLDITSTINVTEDEETGMRTIRTDYFELTLGRMNDWEYRVDDPTRLSIYSTAVAGSDYPGYIMSVQAFPINDVSYDMIPNKVVGVVDKWKIVVLYASDVEYDPEDETATERYLAVREETETIQEGGTSGPLVLKPL